MLTAIMGDGSTTPEAAYFRWHQPDEPAEVPGSRPVPGVGNLVHLRGARTRDGGVAFGQAPHPAIRKAPARRLRRLGQLTSALGIRTSTDDPSVLCEVRPARQANVRAYPRLHVEGARPMFVLPRVGSHLPRRIDERPRVSFVTAMCLFGAWSVGLRDAECGTSRPLPFTSTEIAERVDDVWADERFSLYELETATRLAQLTSALAAQMPAGMPTEVVLLAPREQYYLYLLGAWDRGLVPTSVVRRWLRLVDRRHALVCWLLRYQLRRCFTRHGLRPVIRTAAALQGIAPALADWAAGGEPVTLSWCLSRLASRHPLWREALEVECPRTWSELWYLSYAMEQLYAGRLDDPAEAGHVVAVQEPAEELTFNTADRLAARIGAGQHGRYSSCALLPLERTIVTSEGQKTSLYRGSAAHDLTDEAGRSWTPRHIVERLHQTDRADPLAGHHPPQMPEVLPPAPVACPVGTT